MEIATVETSFKEDALTLKSQAQAIKVISKESYVTAGELGKGMKALRARVVEYFKPLKDAANKAHKVLTTKEAEELKPIDEAIKILADSMDTFNAEQERIRKAAQDKIRAEKEAIAAKEREKLLAQAIKAEEKGNIEKAETLLDKAENVYVAPVTVEPTIDKTVKTDSGANITQAKKLEVSVTDMKIFIAELVKRDLMPNMLEAKTAPLKAFVEVNGFERFPGLDIRRGTGVRF